MIDFLKQLKGKYDSERKKEQNLTSEFYKEERFIDRAINELEWEILPPKEKQEKRLKILSKLEGVNFSNENYQYSGYERKVVAVYNQLMVAKEDIKSKDLDPDLEKLLALILIEMRSIDKNARMKNIPHIDHNTFERAINRCANQLTSADQLLKELDNLHIKPTA